MQYDSIAECSDRSILQFYQSAFINSPMEHSAMLLLQYCIQQSPAKNIRKILFLKVRFSRVSGTPMFVAFDVCVSMHSANTLLKCHQLIIYYIKFYIYLAKGVCALQYQLQTLQTQLVFQTFILPYYLISMHATLNLIITVLNNSQTTTDCQADLDSAL